MEILSSTDWSFAGSGQPFQPDSYFEIAAQLERKLEALRAYRGVMRDFPHPRSETIVRALAACRAGQSGLNQAEAFETAFAAINAREFV
jgi:LmbE family N-acetylglucosaminyl deacetylase